MIEAEFVEKVAALQDEIRLLPDEDAQVVEETAVRLEGLNYAPTTILPVKRFLRVSKIGLLEEIERIILLTPEDVRELVQGDERDVRELQLRIVSVLAYYFKELSALRAGQPEAWDDVDELYVHD